MGIKWIQTNKVGGENKYPNCADENKLVDSYHRDCVGVVVTSKYERYFTVGPNCAGEFMDWAVQTFGRDCTATVERNKDGYQVVVTVPEYNEYR